jgi:hypothetical protein
VKRLKPRKTHKWSRLSNGKRCRRLIGRIDCQGKRFIEKALVQVEHDRLVMGVADIRGCGGW